LEGAVNETIKWLDASQEGSKEEYEDKQKELESIAKYVLLSSFLTFLFAWLIYTLFLSPIMQKLYSAAGGVPGGASGAGGAPGGFPGASQEGPSVEEVD
jgi:L1 cell adhesion molecule like protein